MAEDRHDRIAMPSVRKDGTWDQTNPVFIAGETSVKAAGEQAAVQAVSDIDDAVRTNPDEDPKFTSVDDLRKRLESAANAARKAAESKVSKATE